MNNRFLPLCFSLMLVALLVGLLLGGWSVTNVAASGPGTPPTQPTPILEDEPPICPDQDRPPPDPTDLSCLGVSPTEIDLCWRDNSCTESEFRVERSPDGVTWTEIGTTTRNAASFRDTTVLPGTRYFYRVRAFRVATGQFSGYTNVTSCMTGGLALSKPANGSLVCEQPVFEWTPVSGAITYTLQVGTSPDLSGTLLVNATLTGTTYTPGISFPAGEYFWRVRAENACAVSDWTAVWRFRIGVIVQPPAPISPPDGSTFCNRDVVFTWMATPGALSYELDIDGHIYPVSGTSFFLGSGLTPSRHCWRVRAVGECGPSPWSAQACFTIQIPPNAPVIVGPPDQSSVCNTRPTFNWTPSPGASTCCIQIDDDPAFGSPVVDACGVGPDFTPLSDLAPGIYYWHVRCLNECGTGAWSATRVIVVGSAPGTPTPVSPLTGTTLCSASPTLTWSAVPFITSYRVQLSRGCDFTSPLIDTTVLSTTTSFTVAGPLTPGSYCWRVQAISDCGPGAWSAPQTFTVSTPPAPPLLFGPAENAHECDTTPTFSWAAISGVTGYQIQIDDGNCDFAPPLVDVTVTTPTFTPPSALAPGSYCWRVRSVAECGTSEWSAVGHFAITTTPGPATPIAPLTGASLCNPTPTLTWSAAANATSYRVQLSRSCDFTSPLVDTTVAAPATSFTVGGPLAVGTYCWRVQAVSECGASAWSAPQSFTVSTPPGPPALSSPPNNSGDCDQTPTLTWAPVANAFSYELQVDDASCDFAPGILDVTVQTTSYTVSPALAPGNYCWRVRAIAECGTSEWSGAWHFSVLSVPPAPGLQCPPNNAETCDNTITLCWLEVTGAKSYELELDGIVYSNLAGPCFNTPALGYGPHTWRIRAIGECGQSAWSELRTFYIETTVPSCQELLCNTSFETAECWIDPLACQPRYSTFMAHTGARSQLLGIPTSMPDTQCNSAVWEIITVPADATRVTLSFYYWPMTADTIANDWQEVQIRDANLKVIETLMHVAENNSGSDGWRFKSYDLTRYRGQKIAVYFNVHNNGSGWSRTSMYIDDVSLQACIDECAGGRGTITGQVMLQGRSASFGGIVISADGLPCGVTDANGRFTCTLPAGVHKLTATDCKYLYAELSNVSVRDGATVNVQDALLSGGDANNDTQINLFDMVNTGAAYGTCPGGDNCPGPDINGDGCTNIFDLVIVGGNYGINGPTAWMRPTTTQAAGMVKPARLELVKAGDRWQVWLRGAKEVYGLDLSLRFDADKLSIRGAKAENGRVAEAELRGLETSPHYVLENSIDGAAGSIRVAYSLLNPALPLDGDMVVAEIPVDGSGAAPSFVEALLSDRDGRQLPVEW